MDRKYGHRGYRDAEKQEKHEKKDRETQAAAGRPARRHGSPWPAHAADGGNRNPSAMFELRRGSRGRVRPRAGSVRSAISNCIAANSAGISIAERNLNARSRFRRGYLRKIRRTIAPFTSFGRRLKRIRPRLRTCNLHRFRSKHLHHHGRWMHGRRSRISSRSKFALFLGWRRAHGEKCGRSGHFAGELLQLGVVLA